MPGVGERSTRIGLNTSDYNSTLVPIGSTLWGLTGSECEFPQRHLLFAYPAELESGRTG